MRHIEVLPRKVLIVSPHFPPSSLAGVHRARHLAKHLPTFDWQPIVIRVAEKHYTEPQDIALGALVPQGMRQVRVGAVPAPIARVIGIGDVGIRSYLQLRAALKKMVAKENPKLVMITGAPFYPMLLSRFIAEELHLPVVLDFQDPWVSKHGASMPMLSKAGLAHQLAKKLEPRALRHATAVTCVSDQQCLELRSRYPTLRIMPTAAIPIGGDPEDFNILRATPVEATSVKLDPSKVNFSFVGTFMPRTEPLARIVLRAVARLKKSAPDVADQIRLHFVGTSNQPGCKDWFQVRQIAAEEGVGTSVVETPERIPYMEALSVLSNSNGLLLIGSDEPHYTASKIYPALMSGRPYVSLFHPASSAHDILNRAGGGFAFTYDANFDTSFVEHQIAHALICIATRSIELKLADPNVYAAFSASKVTSQFAAMFSQVATA